MPERFGNYELLEPLASGGMARVFRARMVGALGFEKIVALKFMLPGFANEPEAVKMFIDEARLAATLSHANIVGILDFGEKDGDYYIAMEYISGANLRVLMRRSLETGRQPGPIMASRIVAEVALGLDYAHRKTDSRGNPLCIVHRDVSPQNIVISWTGEVKILDFGIARSINRSVETRAGTIKGKYSYMSPEQARGEPVDARSDLFSLGAVFYELLAGERAFPNPGLETLARVRRADFRPILEVAPGTPPRLAQIVTKAMAANPEDRYPSGSKLVEDLALWLAEERVKGSKGGDAASLAAWAESLFEATVAETSEPKKDPGVLSGWESDNFGDHAKRPAEPAKPRDLTFSESDADPSEEGEGGVGLPEHTFVTLQPLSSNAPPAGATAEAPSEEEVDAESAPAPAARGNGSSAPRPDFAAVAEAIGKPLAPRTGRAGSVPDPAAEREEAEKRSQTVLVIVGAISAATMIVMLGLVWNASTTNPDPPPAGAGSVDPVAVDSLRPTPPPHTVPSVRMEPSSVAVHGTPPPEAVVIKPLYPTDGSKPVGILNVSSTPAGAQVTLNSHPLGGSPVLIPDLPAPGTYLVEIHKDGYAAWSKEVDLEDDNAVQLVAHLATPEVPGRLSLPLPSGVRCFLDGHLIGTGPRRISVEVQPGAHQLRLRDANGVMLRAYEVLIAAGRDAELDVPPTL